MLLFELLLLCDDLHNNSKAISDADGKENWPSSSPVPLMLLLLSLDSAVVGDMVIQAPTPIMVLHSGDVGDSFNCCLYLNHWHQIMTTIKRKVVIQMEIYHS